MTAFESELAKRIRDTVRRHKEDGIVSMHLDNLIQTVASPPYLLDGAPRGTNAQWAYRQLFAGVVEQSLEARMFVY